MRVDTATRSDIEYVARRMRASDYREFSALYPADSPALLSAQMVNRYAGRGDLTCARLKDGTPVAIGGVIESRPNVVTLFFFATDDLPKIGKPLTRFIAQRLFPWLKEAGVHRIECVSMEGHTAAHDWIRTLGLTPEAAPLEGYGKNGERFIQFSWVDERVRKACA